MPDKRHAAWLKFARDILDVPMGRSREDLIAFRNLAIEQYPALVQIVDDYLRLVESSETDVQIRLPQKKRRKATNQMHLFDLLRERTFFPQNLDLSRFAARVLPHMRTYRFDKMSRSDIAARIIEYIENNDPGAREALENSMREALAAMSGRRAKDVERRSFLSKWERIIKGNEQ